MTQRFVFRLIMVVLLGLMVLVGVLALSTATFANGWGLALLVAVMTGLSVAFGILLTEGEISFAHAAGIMGFLALGEAAFPLLTLAVFAGSVGGGWVLLQRRGQLPRRRSVRRTLGSLMGTSARVTLSFVVAGQLYLMLGGALPLRATVGPLLPVLVWYVLAYVGMYTLIYALELYLEDQDVFAIARQNVLAILIVLLLPVAYAVLAAVVYVELPVEFFVLLVFGFVISVLMSFSYSRGRYLLEQQLTEMRLLSEFSHGLQVNTDMRSLMQAVETQLLDVLDVKNLVIAVLNPETDQLQHILVLQDEQRVEQDALDPADAYLIRRLIMQQSPILIEQDVAAYLQRQRVSPHRAVVQSWLGVPMLVRGEPMGAIATHAAAPQTFSEATVRLMQIVASTLVTTIDNVQLYDEQRERVDQLSMLNTISALLSKTLSPESVLEAVTSSAAMLSEAHAVAVYLKRDAPDAPAVLVQSAGLSDGFLQNPPRLLIRRYGVSAAKQTGELAEFPPFVVPDVNSDPRTRHLRELLADEGLSAMIELPLVADEVFRGALVLYFQTSQGFSDEFIEFLRTFSSEAMQSIRNAELYTRTDAALERRLEQLSILASVGQQTNATIDLDTISEVVLRYAVDYTGAQRGMIAMLKRGEDGQIEVKAQEGYHGRETIASAWLEEGTMGKALRGGEQVRTDAADAFPPASKLMPTTASQLVMPILREQTVLGVLVLESDTPRHFQSEAQRFLEQLVTQAAIAIDNRNLFSTVTRSRDRLQVILDAMVEGIVLLNTHGEIVLANPAVRFIGLDPAELLNQNLRDLVERPDGFEVAVCLGFDTMSEMYRLVNAVRGESEWVDATTRYTVKRDNVVRYVERQVIPVRNEDHEVIGALLVYYDQTKQAELNRARGDLMRMLIHDLRSPLTAVTTSMSLIPRLIPDDMDKREQIKQIVNASDQAIRKMLRRVDSLLDVAKLESGQMTLKLDKFQLEDKVDNVFEELQPLAAGRNIQLRLQAIESPLPAVNADGDKIERVVQNLVDNALKYTLPGTDVTVKLAVADGRTAVRLDVIDNGPGIPLAYRDKLFDRFVQMSGQQQERGGVGLGLTFCQLVIQEHGGRIWVEDNPEGGSIFTFVLPVEYDEDRTRPRARIR